MSALLSDPRVFNYLIMSLYLINSARWFAHGNWGGTVYWLSAFAITASVTWGYRH